MKIARFALRGETAYGLVDPGRAEVCLLEGTPFDGIRATEEVRALADVRLLAPVLPSKIVAVGLIYRNHARELGLSIPAEPLIFLKAPSALNHPGGDVVLPRVSRRVDPEAELAVVIGRRAKDVKESDAPSVILGYACFNDVTARDLQRKDGLYARAKGFDTFAPLGPWVETDADPSSLGIRLFVNGEARQDGNTREMEASVFFLVEFISHIMTLFPGDVIATGTPPGVGPVKDGDVMTVEIEGIGSLTNRVVAQ